MYHRGELDVPRRDELGGVDRERWAVPYAGRAAGWLRWCELDLEVDDAGTVGAAGGGRTRTRMLAPVLEVRAVESAPPWARMNGSTASGTAIATHTSAGNVDRCHP